ncbi:MAG TPA: peptide chain release factor N(5)-glutamine methyltransferase [Actinomycetota bacterium]|nr:peptide chain release factor N(5)-glutamine methyltransferase [Actinomycetota bacterium]
MRPAEVVSRSADYLDRHGVEEPRATAEALLQYFLGTDRAGLYARAEGLDTRTAKQFGRALCQRCHGVPLQYLTGEQQFFDLVLGASPGVFVPRPETEVVVERALEVVPDGDGSVAVDVGTGTGAIALAIKRFRPATRVLAIDRSGEAAAVARANASRHALDVEVLEGDLLEPVPSDLRGMVDLVVSNPPYVSRDEYEALPPEVRAEPYEALVGGTDVHRRLAEAAPGWLRAGGWLVMEIGDEQAEEVRDVLAARFESVDVLPDLAGRDRVVRGRLAAQ